MTGAEPVQPGDARDRDDDRGGRRSRARPCATPRFFEGRYADAILIVHSKSPDEALAALETVEDPASPVRVIVSVGMLKEGWDVKNVYVIARCGRSSPSS